MISFTQKEKNIIAEFIYSNEMDILIFEDAEQLIEVFANHNLLPCDKQELLKKVEEKVPLFVSDLNAILETKISKQQRDQIMNEYYAGGN